MIIRQPKYILIAPLDWGLGHTTRCIPLIRHILSLGHIPVFAGNESQRRFIEETFGAIDNIHLDGYDITYSALNRFAQAGLLLQAARILKTIKAENKWLHVLCKERRIDGIISDNRYGLFHSTIPSVILTHQLRVMSGMGTMADRTVQQLHYRLLNRFHETWVVDAPGSDNLGGKLSHTSVLPQRVKYIGLLSQFEEAGAQRSESSDLLVLISGPEPQRSRLSRILWQQMQGYRGKVTFVEGNEQAETPAFIPEHISYHKRLTQKGLLPLLQQAGMVICRSGYSTLMDLMALHKKAILIPTPAQTEQQYLGRHLHEQGMFYCAKQDGFNLGEALQHAQQFSTCTTITQSIFLMYRQVLEGWIKQIDSGE